MKSSKEEEINAIKAYFELLGYPVFRTSTNWENNIRIATKSFNIMIDFQNIILRKRFNNDIINLPLSLQALQDYMNENEQTF